jgi:phospho-N-acetylmuramoyl-pentapeptide-transferase
MIYHLANLLHENHSFFNLFHYVSVRSIGALLTSLFFSFAFGSRFITFCQNNFRSKVRDWTPETHQTKNDTPTMGGLFVLLVFLVNTFLWNNLARAKVWLFLLCMVGFGTIGFLDDWYKIRRSRGISAQLKFKLQIGLALLIASLWYFIDAPDTRLCIPFFKNFMPDIGIFLIPWAAFIMIAASNAVNLTDGLDGLATGPLLCNFSSFAIIAYLAGHKKLAAYLFIPYAGSAELVILAATLIGALLGFLWYNSHPAQIFMGDVGSLPLGAGLGLIALMSRQELLLLIAGGIFVLETVSVMLQVASFKLRGRRIFKMAPIHHHFELLGWPETKITIRFWIVSIILSLVAILTLKIR